MQRLDSLLIDKAALVIDDEPVLRKLTGRVLTDLGMRIVHTAEHGDDALAQLDSGKTRYDVLILDLNMPGMDGVELLRHLATRTYAGGIVLLSGVDTKVLHTAEQLALHHQLHILGAINKPVTSAALGGALARLDRLGRMPMAMQAVLLSPDEIAAGIERDTIIPFFQPKVATLSGSLIGVEALARWDAGDGRVLGPGAFIPVAEECGLIEPLTETIFSKAIAQAAIWQAEGSDFRVAVNFSVHTLNSLTLVDFIVSVARENGVDLDRITVEVTESKLMERLAEPLEVLTRLRMKGVHLSIDDFGTGFSSMEQLKRLPFTELKLDRAFVAGASRDPSTRAMLESTLELARKLEVEFVAEGVETEADWKLLELLSVDTAQGYYVASPMPGPDILPWYKNFRK